MSARELITEHLDLWTGAVKKKSSSGRGSNGKLELTGIKKLRELILDLAVRGKLVGQDSSDEPASLLLERISSEKLRLMKQGEIKKRRNLPALSEMTLPFHLPPNWEWAQLEDVGRDWGQKTPVSEFSYIDVASVDNVRGVTTKSSILSADEAPSRARKVVRPGTLIYSTVRPYLQNIAVLKGEIEPEPIASTAFAILHPLLGMSARFFLHYLRSPAFVRYVESVQTGIAYPAVNDKQFFSGVVPVPPLEEQNRIVQKVDELMALCDRLEQQTSDQLKAHETLVDTLLGTLTQSQNATELAKNWTRLAVHFDTLFTTEQSIDKLKQTILQLAVMGRLAEQSPNDTPAPELLNAIQKEKDRILESKRIKKFKELPPVSAAEEPYKIPSGWMWSRIGSVALYTEYGTSAKTLDSIHGIPVIKMGDIQEGKVLIGGQKHAPKSTEGIHALLLQQGDLLYNRTNSPELVGKTGIFRGPDNTLSFASYLIRIKVEEPLLSSNFLNLAMNSPRFRETEINPHLKQQCGQANVNGTILKQMRVPLPPREEQTRIVQKVDELMALCDQLKECLNQASETRCQLAEAEMEGALN